MAPKVVTSEQDGAELNRLKLDPRVMMDHIIKYIPEPDLVGISKIIFTDLPTDKRLRALTSPAHAAYFAKQGSQPAYIEVYTTNLFGHVRSAEAFSVTYPFGVWVLAGVIFHEVGHHVRRIRSHGIAKTKDENFAEAYARRLLVKYVIENTPELKLCIEMLEDMAPGKGVSAQLVHELKQAWAVEYEAALAREAES